MEQVLVVDRKALEALLPPKEFITEDVDKIHAHILEHHFFLDREKAEYDNTVKQIIPYVLLRQDGRYFLLRRLKKQTEARLHDKLSLGVGGHINPTEETAEDVLTAGLLRELHEEVSVETVRSLTCVGFLNENNGGVSDYHAALVYLLEAQGQVSVLETEKMSGQWATVEELTACLDRLETWSRIAVEQIILPGLV